MKITLLCILISLNIYLSSTNAQEPENLSAKSQGISHVVIVWLKDPGNQEHTTQIIETTKGFTNIPGVTRVQTGRVVKSIRPVVDSSYDLALTIEFESLEALQAYESHPLHKKAIKEVIKPHVKKFVVYDFLQE